MSGGKKLLNSAGSAVDDAIDGLVAAHPGLGRLHGHRVVLRADTQRIVHEEKVCTLSAGSWVSRVPTWSG